VFEKIIDVNSVRSCVRFYFSFEVEMAEIEDPSRMQDRLAASYLWSFRV